MKNKILISVLIIIIIVLGFFVLYQNSKNVAVPSVAEIEQLAPTQNTKTNNVASNVVENVETNNNVASECLPTTIPWIKVLSPNGGESYTAGQQVTVKWLNCNVPSSDQVFISLNKTNEEEKFLSESTINDGVQTFTIPNGLNGDYKIRIGSASARIGQDYSDNTFTIKSSVSTTLPPKYLGAKNWPPVIKTSSVAYSCNPHISEWEVKDTVVEKNINGKKYCITNFTDAGAGQRFSEYTYTTAFGTGTKTTAFTINYSSCGGYGGPGGAEYDQCMSTVSNFLNNLDNLIASLM